MGGEEVLVSPIEFDGGWAGYVGRIIRRCDQLRNKLEKAGMHGEPEKVWMPYDVLVQLHGYLEEIENERKGNE